MNADTSGIEKTKDESPRRMLILGNSLEMSKVSERDDVFILNNASSSSAEIASSSSSSEPADDTDADADLTSSSGSTASEIPKKQKRTNCNNNKPGTSSTIASSNEEIVKKI
ncbi:uncharacterized protein LOC142326614 isoform X2 [Lycorma delicatula]|uniref:uncharacterized protein LOC142326614 isoform X2 n=1 Tax=Lycorma delicatula TaxID=130591 RepID=UPI003F50F2B6